MIKIIDADIMSASEDIIGHQVNCKGKAKSGVCVPIFNAYNFARDMYELACKEHDTASLLGICQLVQCEDKIVANLFGQATYFGFGVKTDYNALETALSSLCQRAKEEHKSIALPYMIGCARGGNWNKVYSIIENVFKDYEVTLYRLNMG